MAEYKDPVIAKLIEKLEAEGPERLRGKYYNGDVGIVPKSEMPVCSIAKDATKMRPADNMTTEHYMPLVINVIWDATEDIGQSEDIVSGVNSLYEVVEGRDETYQLAEETIAYVLMKYHNLDDNLWLAVGPNEEVDIDYGLGINRRGRGIHSLEAVIRVSAKLHKVAVSRL